MADYWTMACFRLGCSDEEAAVLKELDAYEEDKEPSVPPSQAFLAAFPPTDHRSLSGFHEYLKDTGQENSPSFGQELLLSDGVWYYRSADLNLGYIEAIFARVCKSAFPIRFAWAATCSALREDGFGGGVAVIDETGLGGWSTFDLLDRWEQQGTKAEATPWRLWQDEDPRETW